MDHKTFKSDLTYACKKFTKEGKILSSWGDNLFIAEDAFHSGSEYLDALEMLVLIKNYVPTALMLSYYHSTWKDKEGKVYEHHNPHHSGYNLSMVDVIIEQAQIAREDLYSFLDGFDNVEPSTKSEYHAIGIYIREKFLPLAARTKTLTKKDMAFMLPSVTGDILTKYYSFTMRGKTSIYECLCTEVKEFGMKYGEKLYQALKPDMVKGDKWYSTFLFDTAEECRAKIERETRQEFERLVRKKKLESFTEEDIQKKMSDVQVVALTV